MYKIVNRKKRILTLMADLVGHVLFFPVRFFVEPAPILPEAVERILLIRTAYLGDVIMTLPMLKPLKERFPKASITVLTSSGGREILWYNPHVDDVIAYEPFWFYPSRFRGYLTFLSGFRKRSFDLVIEARRISGIFCFWSCQLDRRQNSATPSAAGVIY